MIDPEGGSDDGLFPGPRPARRKPATRRGAPTPDPLSEDLCEALLRPVDVVRDPLQGDVRITALERAIIDTPEFQRLRRVLQLGLTHLAYPGATHTRHLHSIGTLHVCGRMIDTCNANADVYSSFASTGHARPLTIGKYPVLLARLCALMHDMAHVPFGHTLEKEGRVFKTDEWADDFRRSQVFGADGTFRRSFVAVLRNSGASEESANQVLDDVRLVLTTPRREVDQLPYPFVHDLVGNTICADLIDYVRRDMFFCGLTETIGERFLNYLAVLELAASETEESPRKPVAAPPPRRTTERRGGPGLESTERVVLLQYRYNERRRAVSKHDVVAEAIDLVRRRLTVAEKLYFHRTKVVASAMLLAAVHDSGLVSKDIWDLSDEGVIALLVADAKHPRAQGLGRRIRDRRLLKPIYRLSHRPPNEHVHDERLTGICCRFLDPKRRAELIEQIEEVVRLERDSARDVAGSVAISCPKREMNVKQFDMLVLQTPDASVRRLQETEFGPSRHDIQAIQDGHRHLWRFDVYVDPDLVSTSAPDAFARRLAAAIARTVGLPNELDGFEPIGEGDLSALVLDGRIESILRGLGLGGRISVSHLGELRSQAAQWSSNLHERIGAFAKEKGYPIPRSP